MTLVIGLISGTSVDGIDAALVDISGTNLDIKIELVAGATYPYSADLRERILAVCAGEAISMAQLAELDDAIAFAFAQAAQNIQIGHEKATLIGSHGQTVFHRPPTGGETNSKFKIRLEKFALSGNQRQSPTAGNPPAVLAPPGNFSQNSKLGPSPSSPSSSSSSSSSSSPRQSPQVGKPAHGAGSSSSSSSSSPLGYTLQLGRGAVIANLTGITTVSNHRVADIAAGGHGAPLVPRIDAALLSHPQEARCIQNLGGIGNVTYMPPRRDNWLEKIRAWDTGPANSLLDLAVEHLTDGAKSYDENGNWAASGTPCYPLVEEWLSQDYFHLPPPKSTGRELFGVAYLQQCLQDAEAYQLSPADFLATLTELTAASIVHSYRTFLPQMPERVLLCGGGSRNLYLKSRLQQLLASVPVLTTDEVGLSADFKEAIAFAVLAYWRQSGTPGNLPTATGASQEVLLGEVYSP